MREIELIDKREINVKHFLQKDGTIKAKIYSEPIHYLKNGRYEEIDNTLVKRSGTYVNKSNDYAVLFDETAEKSLIKMEKNGFYLDMKLDHHNETKLRKLKASSKLVGGISFDNIIENVDIEYKTLPTKVKETIVLKDNKINSFSFLINTNLELQIDANKNINALSDSKKVFTIEKPYVEDSNGEKNYDLFYELEKNDDNYKLNLIIDEQWLNDEKRAYPVYVDPTIISNETLTSYYDTYIYQGDTGTTRYDKDILKAGVEKVNNNNVINRTLIWFDLPNIGTASEVISATLTLCGYVTYHPTSSGFVRPVEIHRITESWDETLANWDNMNDKYDPRIDGIQFAGRSYIENNTIIPQYSSDVYGDITDLVKHWYKDTDNYGLMIKSLNEQYIDDNYPAFYSKDHNITDADPSPIIEIAYRNQNGLENYWNYITEPLTSGNTYVNTYNGNLVGVFDLTSTLGNKLPAILKLIYNTNDVLVNNNGFKFSLLQTIKEVSIGNETYYEYSDEDNTIHYFKYEQHRVLIDASNVPTIEDIISGHEDDFYEIREYISDEDGLMFKLENIDGHYVITDKYGNKMNFYKNNPNSELYYLKSIVDSENRQITITHDSNDRIVSVIDSNNDEITIDYDTVGVISIEDPIHQTLIAYSCDNINSITTYKGTTTFNYNQNNLISSIVDTNLTKVEYEYYEVEPYRIKKVKEYGLNNILGKTLEFQYGFNETKIIDGYVVNNIIFNSSGNKISDNIMLSDNDFTNAYSTYSSIFEDLDDKYYQKNKMISSKPMIRYVNNMLTNTSFETDVDNFVVTSNLTKTFDITNYVTGNRSLKLESADINQSASYQITPQKGKDYTFSGYFKSSDNVQISLSYYDENSELIEATENIKLSSIFEREDVTIYYDENATSPLYISIIMPNSNTVVYIDDIQLEVGKIANNYSIVENSDFSNGFSDWTCEPIDSALSNTYQVVDINSQSNKALKINLNNSRKISKVFPIKGNMGDTYDISFWLKNEGIYADAGSVMNCVEITFNPVDDNQEQYSTLTSQFVPNKNWQFFSTQETAIYAFKSITVEFTHSNEFNDLYITDISLYKNLNSTYYHYDTYGNLMSTNDTEVANNVFKYDENNQLISSINSTNSSFKFEYDNNDKKRIINAVTPEGLSTKIGYDSNGNPTIIKIVKSNYWRLISGFYTIRIKGTNKYIKLVDGQFVPVENPCSNTVFNLEENQNEEILNNCHYRLSLANNQDHYLKAIDNRLVLQQGNDTEGEYGSSNYTYLITKRDNGSYTIEYKASDSNYGLLKFVNDELIFVQTKEYNNPACQFYFENAKEKFIESKATYTSDGKFLTSVTDSLLNTTTYSVNSLTGLVNSVENANNITKNYQYNSKNQVTAIIQGDKQVSYQYNNQNLLSKISQGNKEYNFEYDDFLNQKKVKVGNNITLITNTYDASNSKIISSTYGNNNTVSYTYDEFDRVKTYTKSNDCYSYEYDSKGRVGKIISSLGIKKFNYDNSDRISKYVDRKFKVKYNYNNNNLVIQKNHSFDDSNNLLHYAYDDDNNLIGLSIGNSSINYTYDGLGRIINKQYNYAYNTKYNYLTFGNRTINVLESVKNGNNMYSYQYDNLYNITDIYNNGNLIKHYTYDSYTQLIREEDILNNQIIEYDYDDYSNITKKTIKDLSTESVIDVINYTYRNPNWVDQLTNYNGTTITYDEIGNPVSIGNNITMSWSNGRELVGYSDSANNKTITYIYDETGNRITKTINGVSTNYYYENDKLIYEETNNNRIYYLHNLTGVIGMIYNSNVYYFIKNAHQDVIGIIDSNYNQVVTYEYDAWGNILSIKDSNGLEISDITNIGLVNPFRYRSYYYDSETKLYYLYSRYYNAEWCRFLNADGIIGAPDSIIDTNIYCYANNNPVYYSDTNGKIAIAIGGFAAYYIGVAIASLAIGYAASAAAPSIVQGINNFISSVKSNSKSSSITDFKTKVQEQAITQTQANTCPMPINDDTVIYRYGYKSIDKLVPSYNDAFPTNPNELPSLSFMLKPKYGTINAVTTIGKVNASKYLYAVNDHDNHIAVIPKDATVADWYFAGVGSKWTEELAKIVYKWDLR